MKAYELAAMMFVFNGVLFLFGILGIYNVGYDPFSPGSAHSIINIWTIIGLLGIMGAGATFSIITPKGEKAAVYASLIGVFVVLWFNTAMMFNSLFESFPYGIHIYTFFSTIFFIVFIVGVYQMATGGWKSYV